MADFSIEVKGERELLENLRQLAQRIPGAIAEAMYVEWEIEATEMKRRTPVDTGALRNSIRVQPPRVGREISVTIRAGGPAAPYAVVVHEDEEALHKVGQAKFVESVVLESKPFLLARIARRFDIRRLF